MPEAESNLPTKTEPQTTSFHPQKQMYKSSTISTTIPAKNLVEIGTRGTIGFLITPVKKKKGASKLIPSMCSVVEVAEESNIHPNPTSKFCYRNLKPDLSSQKALRNRVS